MLGQRLFLGQETPVPVCLSQSRICVVPRFGNRNHVEYSETLHVLRMIQGHTVADASSSVVTDQYESRKAKFAHHLKQFRLTAGLSIRKVCLQGRGDLRPHVSARI